PGVHSLRVELSGYETIEEMIELEAGLETLRFELDKVRRGQPARSRPRKGTLSVVTRPSADVYIGGRKIGTTPFANKSLDAGTFTLVFKQGGREVGTERVSIKAGQTTKLNVTLGKR